MNKILLPVEDRFFADAQVNFLAKYELIPNSKISILTVAAPFVPPDCGYAFPSPYWEQMIIENENSRKKLISEVLKKLKALFPDMEIEAHIVNGSAAPEILRFAKEGKFDWIIMGSHGRTGFDKLLLGSVAQSVSSHAQCSVSIIRCPIKGKHEESEREEKNNNKDRAAVIA